MANTKVTLTITIPDDIHKKLRKVIGSGKVSEFVSETIKKELQKREEKIIADYQKGVKNKDLKEEMEGWYK